MPRLTDRELRRRLSGIDRRIADLESDGDGDDESADGPRTYTLAELLDARTARENDSEDDR